MNGGKFDGGQLSQSEKDLRDFYKRLLNFTINSDALMGKFQEIQTVNRHDTANYDEKIYSYVRWSANEKLIVVTNFSPDHISNFDLKLPADVVTAWHLHDGVYPVKDQLYGGTASLHIANGVGTLKVTIKESESFIYKL